MKQRAITSGALHDRAEYREILIKVDSPRVIERMIYRKQRDYFHFRVLLSLPDLPTGELESPVRLIERYICVIHRCKLGRKQEPTPRAFHDFRWCLKIFPRAIGKKNNSTRRSVVRLVSYREWTSPGSIAGTKVFFPPRDPVAVRFATVKQARIVNPA